MIPAGVICRIVSVEDAGIRENIGKLVVTAQGYSFNGKRRVEALESVLAGTQMGLMWFPAGAKLRLWERNIRPLGDEGPEERDLFGLPEPKTTNKVEDFSMQGWAR